MDDLAEELGISKKTLYAYFPGKFDLLEAVLADKLTGVEATLKEVTRAHPDDFPATLRELLAGTQRELDEIKPPFVRDTDVAVLKAQLFDPPPELASLRPDLPPAPAAVTSPGSWPRSA